MVIPLYFNYKIFILKSLLCTKCFSKQEITTDYLTWSNMLHLCSIILWFDKCKINKYHSKDTFCFHHKYIILRIMATNNRSGVDFEYFIKAEKISTTHSIVRRFAILLWLSGCKNFSGPLRKGPLVSYYTPTSP